MSLYNQSTDMEVKRDRSLKIALNARVLHESVEKDNHQMPNLENHNNILAQKLQEERLLTVDSKHVYKQTLFHREIAKICIFETIGCSSIRT